ncbi:MAG: ABC transporter permease [Gemmataceae bacterium]
MKPAALIEKLDDKLNPIVVKELRQAFQGRWVVGALLSFLTLQVVILGISLMFTEPFEDGSLSFHAGRDVFRLMQGILLTTCMLLAPTYAGMRLAAERNDANVDLLFISTLTPRAIIWGKFCAAIILTLLIFSACAPFMIFTYLLRGIDLITIALVLVIDFAAVVSATQIAIFAASIPGNRALRGMLGLGTFIGLIYLFVGTLMGTIALTQFGVPVHQPEFWWGLLTCTLLLLMAIALLFTASVSIVSPPSTNRALPVRVALLATWLFTGAAALAWCYFEATIIPAYIWLACAVGLFTAYLAVAINEREEWTPRVARTIPRNVLFRIGAFLMYSGSAGGVLFCVLLSAASYILVGFVETWDPTWYSHLGRHDDVRVPMAILGVYGLGYALAAVFVRRHLMSRWLRPEFTWVMLLVLIGLASTVPYLLHFLIMPRHYRVYSEFNLWAAPNPFVALADWTNRHEYLAFGSVCTGIIVVMNLPWLIGQFDRFRRFEVSQPVEVASEAVPVLEVVPVVETFGEA